MKNSFTSKKFLKFGFMLMLFCSVFAVVSSCKKDDEPEKPSSYNVKFRVSTSNGAKITAIIYQVGTQQTTNLNATGTSWETEMTVPSSDAAVFLSAKAVEDPAIIDPKVTVEILINGEAKAVKEASTGENLQASVQYSFL